MAKVHYCWRCQMEIPMLDEQEWAEVLPSLHQGAQEALTHYNQMTGLGEANPNAIWHHRTGIYGPPCENCGKPYRTPHVKYCVACKNTRPVYHQ
jgi:hypothetical protein